MEGSWRGLRGVAVVVACAALAVGGCGLGSSADTVRTDDPVSKFAPLVWLHGGERLLPADAPWLIGRSLLRFGDDHGCPDRKVSVGAALPSQRTDTADYTVLAKLGHGPAYGRTSANVHCKRVGRGPRFYANTLTRPRDPSPRRESGLKAREGYYLDLADGARRGRPLMRDGDQAIVAVPAYFESRRAEVGGESGLRITYWLLFGASEPHGDGDGVEELAREGDWERVEVLLRGDGEYEPQAVRVSAPDGGWRQLPWDDLRHAAGGGGEATHPVLFAARGSHTLHPRAGLHVQRITPPRSLPITIREPTSAPCVDCGRWATWQLLQDVRVQPWYGFGGAWGDLGAGDLSTGPLGPHGEWSLSHFGVQARRGEAAEKLRRAARGRAAGG